MAKYSIMLVTRDMIKGSWKKMVISHVSDTRRPRDGINNSLLINQQTEQFHSKLFRLSPGFLSYIWF